MIVAPAVSTLPTARLYADSGDTQVIYVDLLNPAPTKGNSATRWMPIPDQSAYLVGEVRFGPGPDGFTTISGLPPHTRLLPMPWESVPVFVWYRKGDGIEMVAHGKTSGFGQSNAVFNGSAPLAAMISPVMIGAELACKIQIAGAHITGKGDVDAVMASLPKASIGARAPWDATLGQVLIDLLSGLLQSGSLSLSIELENSKQKTGSAMIDELSNLALLEWAHRIQVLVGPELTLAAPAALVKSDSLAGPVSLGLDWPVGARLTLRAVRVLRSEERTA
jgi:hypothetical protein